MNETNVNERKHENADFHVVILKNDASDDVHENGAQLVFAIPLMIANLHLLDLLKENQCLC